MTTESDSVSLDETQLPRLIDSSALTKYAAKEEGWENVEKYLSSADSLGLALVETSNALWKKINKKEIELEKAVEILQILAHSIWFLDQQKYLVKALEIAVRYKITSYDSLFLACAEMEESELISSDSKQLAVAKKLGIKNIVV
jgi:predicted nucleic acid-binding protein